MENTTNYWKINFKIRYFYSKGTFVVLLWNTLIQIAVCSALRQYGPLFQGIQNAGALYQMGLVPVLLTVILAPLTGWLADSKLGNYRVFKLGCFTLFLPTVIASIICIVILENTSNHTLSLVISGGIVPIMYALGACGLFASIITALQLGLDQMPDASSDNITSFIAWFVCSMFASYWISECVYFLPYYCTNRNYWLREQLFSLLPVLCMTVVCCSIFSFAPKWLIIEPESPKALKTIYQVLKFAAKHKAPLNRSALTYWEEDIPSRLDLGKSRFGGPFTAEQVEDVKTAFKILIIYLPTFLACIALNSTQNIGLVDNIYDCTTGIEYTLVYSPWWNVVVTTVVYELVVYPLIRNKVPSSLKRVGIVSFLTFVVNCGFLFVSICKFVHLVDLSELQWPYNIHLILFGVTITFLINGVLEFVCAQSPYNMRGLFTGCTFFLLFFSIILGGIVFGLFNHCKQEYIFVTQNSFTTALSLVGFILHCVLAHWYKRRVRDEDYPVHRVVEEVYDRYLSHAH